MKRAILYLLFSVSYLMLQAQNIDFVIPAGANKEYFFSIPNGLKQDTVVTGTVSMMGTGRIVIPEKYKEVAAMSRFSFENETPINLIVNNENFSFEQFADGKLSFNGSLENDLFYNRKQEVMNKEYDSTYVQSYAKMMSAISLLSRVLNQQAKTSLFEKSNARIGILNSIDVDKLYYSNLWFYIINGLMQLSAGEEGFANDLIRLLDKTKSQKVYVAFVEDIIMITNQYGLDDAFDIVIPHVEASVRIEYPQGTVYDAFAMAKVRKGVVAPAIEGLFPELGKTNDDYTLLMFHQPGCSSCEAQLKGLRSNYESLRGAKVRIVTLSGALDKKMFAEESANFLWKDRLCDLKGFAGANFIQYGIIGTPTIYLIDKQNTVLGRFSMISEINLHIKDAF